MRFKEFLSEVKSKKELSVFDKHQLKVARDIIKAPDAMVPFMGGNLTKKEAREIIKKITGKEVKESVEEGKKGLDHWVKDYRAARKNGNVSLAKQLRDNIDKEVKRLGLNRDEVYGPDLDNKYGVKEGMEYEEETNKEPKGFYIMGKYQSVAWYPAHKKEEAEKHVKQLNYRGGTDYRLEPDFEKKPTFDQSVTKHQDEKKDESIDPKIVGGMSRTSLLEALTREPMTYVYHVNLDERGSFRADVRNPKNDKTVYEVRGGDELGEDESSLVDDGYMRNLRDVQGLQEYLREMGVIGKQDRIMHAKDVKEAVEIPVDVSMEKLESMFDAAKRALSLANKFKDPADKKKHLSQVMSGLNKIRNAVQRMIKTLDIEPE